jgi:glutamate carboxypeptidase
VKLTLSPMSRGWLSQFQARAPALLGDLEALVRLESPSDDADRVSGAAAWIRDRLREAGVPAELRPCPPRGAALLASLGPPEGGTLLLGHLDTVWPVGTLGERPWRLEGGRAHGPGVFDMKAGIAVGMAVLAAVARESPAPRVSMLLVPDEEVGSAASRELTVSVARRNRRVLVLEPSQDGAAKVARKGCGTFRVTFSGRAAHAGLEPERGASALAEMARFVLFLDRVADPSKGTALTPTVARAGCAANVVPEAAELSVDGRAWSRGEAERATSALRGYRPADQGVTVVVEGGFDRPPLEPSAASTALYETARRLAADLGFDLGAARVGGGSDGNFTAAAGIPTLDGLGPRGDGAHARDEHVLVGDLSVRAALLTALVCEA